MNNPKLFRTNSVAFLLCIFCYLFPRTAYLEDVGVNWYKVELIVFGQESITSEKFDQTSALVEPPGNYVELKTLGVRLDALPSEPVPYSTVSSRYAELTSLYNKLGRSTEYIPKLRLAWIEPVKKNRFGRAVHISKNQVNGFVRLQRGNYLHVAVDFNIVDDFDRDAIPFSEDLSNGPPDNVSEIIYHLKERRRILLGETHYFDHPKFGLIVKVSLLKLS